MCEYCEFPFKKFDGMYGCDYFGYGLDADGNVCLKIEADFGYEGLDDACKVGPASGLAFCMFCGRAFADGENRAEERDLAAAALYEEGLLVIDFENGERVERPFLYLHKPISQGDWSHPSEIGAFSDDASLYADLADAVPVALKAFDQDDVEWDAVWVSSSEYGRDREYKHLPVFYTTDETFWA